MLQRSSHAHDVCSRSAWTISAANVLPSSRRQFEQAIGYLLCKREFSRVIAVRVC
jgi:hypothetical protein